MKTLFSFQPERCSACGACAIACMDQNDTDLAAGQPPLRTVLIREEAGRQVYTSLSCLHCADAPCIKSCPTGCLYKDEDMGLTLFEQTKCVGCRRCLAACPVEAPRFVRLNGRTKMVKCDGCAERLKNGLEPACVRACPTGALACGFRRPVRTEPDLR